MTLTELQLLAIHKAPVVPLADICERYLGNNHATAKRKAALHALPFPVFQIEEGNSKAPWFVRVADIAKLVDAKSAAGAAEWTKSQV